MSKKLDTEISIAPRVPATNVVHVTLPISVYYQLDKFQKVHAAVLGRLGCSNCTSGFDVRYNLVNRFIVDEKLNINEEISDIDHS